MGLFSRKSKKEGEKKLETKGDANRPLDAVRARRMHTNKKGGTVKVEKKMKSVKMGTRRFSDVDRVLVRPLVTEKISNLGMYNQYAFRVSPRANKVQIKKAVETYYKVKPVRVNVVRGRGKNIRWGRTRGMTSGWKKAIVTLRAGDKIELYEGV